MALAADTRAAQHPGGLYTDNDRNLTAVKSGHTLQVDGSLDFSTAGEFKRDGVKQPANVTFSYAAGGTDISDVTVTVVDASGTAIAGAFILTLWLSDAASGAGLTATAASGTVQAKAASGADFSVLVAKKAFIVQTLATGIYTLRITDSAKTGFYPAATVPSKGSTAVGAQMAAGNYG